MIYWTAEPRLGFREGRVSLRLGLDHSHPRVARARAIESAWGQVASVPGLRPMAPVDRAIAELADCSSWSRRTIAIDFAAEPVPGLSPERWLLAGAHRATETLVRERWRALPWRVADVILERAGGSSYRRHGLVGVDEALLDELEAFVRLAGVGPGAMRALSLRKGLYRLRFERPYGAA